MQAFEVSTESSYYYYVHNGELTQPPILKLTPGHPVDHGAARSALARAARTYPQLSSRLAHADGRFYCVENELPVALYGAEDEACVLGSAATNHHQHRAWAEGSTPAIVANRGLADGHFLWRFMVTLLYYYGVELGLVKEGGRLEGVSLEGDVAVPAFDPYVRYANTDQAPAGTPGIGPILSLPVTYAEDRGDYRRHVDALGMSFSQLRAAAKRVGSRVPPFVAALEAAAMREVWDTAGASLIGPIMDDMRPFFEAPGVGNFSNWVIAVLPGPLAPLLREAEYQMPGYTTAFGLLMASVGDALRMTIARSFDGDDFTLAFVRQLEGQGVGVRLEDRGWRGFPTMGHDAVLELGAEEGSFVPVSC